MFIIKESPHLVCLSLGYSLCLCVLCVVGDMDPGSSQVNTKQNSSPPPSPPHSFYNVSEHALYSERKLPTQSPPRAITPTSSVLLTNRISFRSKSHGLSSANRSGRYMSHDLVTQGTTNHSNC